MASVVVFSSEATTCKVTCVCNRQAGVDETRAEREPKIASST